MRMPKWSRMSVQTNLIPSDMISIQIFNGEKKKSEWSRIVCGSLTNDDFTHLFEMIEQKHYCSF